MIVSANEEMPLYVKKEMPRRGDNSIVNALLSPKEIQVSVSDESVYCLFSNNVAFIFFFKFGCLGNKHPHL